MAPACAVLIPAIAACGLERAASRAKPMATIEAIESFFDWNIWRAMCRCVTCAISCPSTPASSDSFCAATIKPVWTPMKPPGIAKALMLGSAMGKK